MPIGAFNQSLNLASPVITDSRIFRGFVRSLNSTQIAFFNTAGTQTGAAQTHGCGTLQIIRTMKLPNSNDQIIAMGGSSGRRVYHFNTTTNVYTSIYNSTAITNITTCDITFNTANDKFYVAWGANTTTTTNRVRLSTGTLSAPTTAMSETGLADPGAAPFSSAWTANGNLLAVRTGTTIRTYFRAAGDTMALNSTSITLTGGNAGAAYEDISWNAAGTILMAADENDRILTRYTSNSTGTLTSPTTFTVPTPATGADRPIVAFNPNPAFSNVLAVGIRGAFPTTGLSGLTFMYFADGGAGDLNSSPGNTGYVDLANTNAVRQVRWSPTGDRLIIIYQANNRHYPFTYSEGSTATVATSNNSFTQVTSGVTDYAFDWIYY